MTPSQRLAANGLTIPPPPEASGPYRSVVRSGILLFVSAQPPKRSGTSIATGRYGVDVDRPQLEACITQAAWNVLAQLHHLDAGIDDIASIVRSTIYVASSAEQELDWCPKTAAGVFAHALGAGNGGGFVMVGAGGLPGNAPVVIESIARVRERTQP